MKKKNRTRTVTKKELKRTIETLENAGHVVHSVTRTRVAAIGRDQYVYHVSWKV